MNWKPPNPAYERLIAALLSEVSTLYVVGGAVRDYLLNRDAPVVDLDIVVMDRAIPVARRVADRLGWAYYPMDSGRDVARLVFNTGQGGSLTCDIAGSRGATIEDDLAARDFTINAMALELHDQGQARLLDPYGGVADLDARVLRRVSALSLSEDSIRLLRAVRLIVQFDLSIEAATYAQIERLNDTARLGSAERARDELWKMMQTARPRTSIEVLDSFGLLRHVLPELWKTQGVEQSSPHYQDVYRHTLSCVDWAACLRDWLESGVTPSGPCLQPELFQMLSAHKFNLRRHFSQDVASGHTRGDWLVWHALLHDIGKPATATVESEAERAGGDDAEVSSSTARLRFFGHEKVGAEMATNRLTYLRFSRQEVALCASVIAAHMRPHSLHNSFPDQQISRRAAFRYFRDVGGRQFGRGLGVDTVLLALADLLAIYPAVPDNWDGYLAHMDQLLQDHFSAGDATSTDVRPLLNGHQLQKRLGISEGRQVGALLEQILEAQAAGEVSTPDEALSLARTLLEDEVGVQ